MSSSVASSKSSAGSKSGSKPDSSSSTGKTTGVGYGSKPNAWSKPLQSKGSQGNKANSGTVNHSHGNRKSTTPPPPPGLGMTPSSTSINNNKGKSHHKSSHEDNISSSDLLSLRERYLHLLLTLTGQNVTVTLQSGKQYTGVLHTATPFGHLPESQRYKYVLKQAILQPSTVAAVSTITATTNPKSTPLNATTNDDNNKKNDASTAESKLIIPTLILDMTDVIQLQVKSFRMDSLQGGSTYSSNSNNNNNSNISISQQRGDAFTDTEISSSNARGASIQNKELVSAGSHWTTEPLPGGSNNKTNSRASALKGNIADWDQFKANEELFNVKAEFDETVYTTPLPSHVSIQDEQRAAQLAREIESTATTNIHLAEERGHVMNQDYDEEDRYSGVLRSTSLSNTSIKKKNNTDESVSAISTSSNNNNNNKTKVNYAAVAAKPQQARMDNANESAVKVEQRALDMEQGTKKSDEVKADVDKEKESVAVVMEQKKDTVASPILTESLKEEGKAEDMNDKVPTNSGKESKEKEEAEEVKSKLNVNAKSFSFNINAKSFTPGAPSIPPPPPQLSHQAHFVDPNTGYPIFQMAPGMMPTMMPQGMYPGMRYPQYPGMDPSQHIQPPPMPQQQPHPHLPTESGTPSIAASGATSPAVLSEEGSLQPQSVPQPQEGGDTASETSSIAASQQFPPPLLASQQQPMPMYAPQPGYYPGGQMMHPGPQHPQQFMHPAQFAAMQQQQRQMYPLQPGMPPNMMRAPMPYYSHPNGPMPYPLYNQPYDDDSGGGGGGMNMYGGGRGGRGRGSGRGNRGGVGARGGRGRRGGGYNSNMHYTHSGGSNDRLTSQQTTPLSIPDQTFMVHQGEEVILRDESVSTATANAPTSSSENKAVSTQTITSTTTPNAGA